MNKYFVAGIAVLALVGCSNETALAPGSELPVRSVQIVNNSELAMSSFSASPITTRSWGRNWLPLPARSIAAGGAYTVNLTDSDECDYDMRAEYFGARSIVVRNVNICEISQYVFSQPNAH